MGRPFCTLRISPTDFLLFPKFCLYNRSLKFVQVPSGNKRPAEVYTWGSRMEGGTQHPSSQLLLSSLCLDPGLAHDGSVYRLPRATVTKASQAGGLTTADVYCLTIPGWGGRSWKSRCQQGHTPAEGLEDDASLPLSFQMAAGLIFVSMDILPSSLRFSLCIFSFSYKDSSHIGLRVHPNPA